jgi:hypothetical protein
VPSKQTLWIGWQRKEWLRQCCGEFSWQAFLLWTILTMVQKDY